MTVSLSIERFILNGDRIHSYTKLCISLKVFNEKLGILIIILRVQRVVVGVAGENLGDER